jgi:hypothetical protein
LPKAEATEKEIKVSCVCPCGCEQWYEPHDEIAREVICTDCQIDEHQNNENLPQFVSRSLLEEQLADKVRSRWGDKGIEFLAGAISSITSTQQLRVLVQSIDAERIG